MNKSWAPWWVFDVAPSLGSCVCRGDLCPWRPDSSCRSGGDTQAPPSSPRLCGRGRVELRPQTWA